MSFKVIGDFENHYMVKHPDGSSFPIAKKGISEETHQKIKGWGKSDEEVKMADGGIVPGSLDDGGVSSLPKPVKPMDPTLGIERMTPQEAKIQEQKDFLQLSNPNIYSAKPDLLDTDAQNMVLNQSEREFNSKNAASISAQTDSDKKAQADSEYNLRAQKLGLPLRQVSFSPDQGAAGGMKNAAMVVDGHMIQDEAPKTPEDPMRKAYDASFGQARSAIGGLAEAAKQQGDSVSAALNEQMKAEADAKELSDTHFENLKKEKDDLTDQYMNGKLDPNRVWSGMNTGNKVTAAISIILGGIGAGLTGKSNVALDVINSAIDKDMESQRADMGKTQNLLAMNMQKYKNEQDAYNMTKVQILSATQAKIGLAASKMGTAQAISAAKMQVAELEIKQNALISETSKNMVKNQITGLAASGKIDPNSAQFLDADTRERYIPGEGLALTKEGAKDIRSLKNDRDASVDAIDQLINMRTQYGGKVLPGELKSQAKTYAGILQGKLRTFLVGPGAVSDAERKILESVINSDPLTLMAMSSQILGSLKTIKGAVNSGYENALVNNGVKRGSSTFKRTP